jgi:hypothetical protein
LLAGSNGSSQTGAIAPALAAGSVGSSPAGSSAPSYVDGTAPVLLGNATTSGDGAGSQPAATSPSLSSDPDFPDAPSLNPTIPAQPSTTQPAYSDNTAENILFRASGTARVENEVPGLKTASIKVRGGKSAAIVLEFDLPKQEIVHTINFVDKMDGIGYERLVTWEYQPNKNATKTKTKVLFDTSDLKEKFLETVDKAKKMKANEEPAAARPRAQANTSGNEDVSSSDEEYEVPKTTTIDGPVSSVGTPSSDKTTNDDDGSDATSSDSDDDWDTSDDSLSSTSNLQVDKKKIQEAFKKNMKAQLPNVSPDPSNSPSAASAAAPPQPANEGSGQNPPATLPDEGFDKLLARDVIQADGLFATNRYGHYKNVYLEFPSPPVTSNGGSPLLTGGGPPPPPPLQAPVFSKGSGVTRPKLTRTSSQPKQKANTLADTLATAFKVGTEGRALKGAKLVGWVVAGMTEQQREAAQALFLASANLTELTWGSDKEELNGLTETDQLTYATTPGLKDEAMNAFKSTVVNPIQSRNNNTAFYSVYARKTENLRRDEVIPAELVLKRSNYDRILNKKYEMVYVINPNAAIIAAATKLASKILVPQNYTVDEDTLQKAHLAISTPSSAASDNADAAYKEYTFTPPAKIKVVEEYQTPEHNNAKVVFPSVDDYTYQSIEKSIEAFDTALNSKDPHKTTTAEWLKGMNGTHQAFTKLLKQLPRYVQPNGTLHLPEEFAKIVKYLHETNAASANLSTDEYTPMYTQPNKNRYVVENKVTPLEREINRLQENIEAYKKFKNENKDETIDENTIEILSKWDTELKEKTARLAEIKKKPTWLDVGKTSEPGFVAFTQNYKKLVNVTAPFA